MDALERDHPMKRLQRQLNETVSRGRPAYLAVTDGMSEISKQGLRQWLAKNVNGNVKLVFMEESQIVATGNLLREHLGVPKPRPPGRAP